MDIFIKSWPSLISRNKYSIIQKEMALSSKYNTLI